MLYFANWKIAVVLLVCLTGLVFSLPNTVSKDSAEAIPTWLPHKQINLGLDLQGGAHLLFEVDTAGVIKDHLNSLEDSARQALRKKPRVGYTGLGVKGQAVTFRLRSADDADKALERLDDLVTTINPNPLMGVGGGRDLTIEADQQGTITIRPTEEALRQWVDSAVRQSIEIVRKRIDEFGIAEPTVQRQGQERILLQLPGVKDPERIKKTIKTTAKMTFQMVDVRAEPGSDRVPPGSERLRNADASDPVQFYIVRKRVEVSGENLVDAQPTYDQGQPVVSFRFDSKGGKRFADTTTKNVGKPFAIVLDDEVISAPVIREPILQASGIITGNFTAQEASDLALLLRAGALPAELTVIEERTVGPDLGADSIQAGKIACVLGFALVIVFMVVAYGLFGLIADAALITNLFLIVGALSIFQVTLTLPGIAGIVLTIGMAVDANVLIFERIREELRAGKSPFNGVEAGYKRAVTTIVDANVTTFIAAFILYAFGSGPVQGFAVTLGLGILSSLFTAIVLSRMLVSLWLRRTRPATLSV